MILKIYLDQTTILLSVVYRLSRTLYPQTFVDIFTATAHLSTNHIVLGDLNINMLVENPESRFLRDFFTTFDLRMLNELPTHHTDQSHTLLDLCITNNNSNIYNFTQSGFPFLSGHEMISLDYQITTVIQKERVIKYRDFRNIDLVKLNNCGEIMKRRNYANDADIDTAVDSLNLTILSAINECAPLKTLSLKKSSKTVDDK